MANITTRTKDSENDDKSELGKRKHYEAERLQAKKINNILDHISVKDENTFFSTPDFESLLGFLLVVSRLSPLVLL